MSSPFARAGGSGAFDAKYAGVCAGCGSEFEKGESIRYDDDEIVHADPADCIVSARIESQTCNVCMLQHRGECW